MIKFQTHSCQVCGEEFKVACASELENKMKKHKCVRLNKRRERTALLQQRLVNNFVSDVAVDRIHEHNFNQLVKQGMIV